MNRRAGFIVSLCILISSLILSFTSSDTFAQTGSIKGVVRDAETGQPLSLAEVILVGPKIGGIAARDGSYEIVNVPIGTYSIEASMMGYDPVVKSGVRVDADATVEINFTLERTIVDYTIEIIVEAPRPMIKFTESEVSHEKSGDEMEELPVDDLKDVVALIPGFIRMGEDLHGRGGRQREVQFQIGGVPVDDPLGGGAISVGILATDRSEVIIGGMDAEYGNAQSAIINVSTREGGEVFGGQVRYMTDDFGRKDKTYTNYDRISLGFGGPTFTRDLTYYVSGEATFTDTENWTIARKNEQTLLGDWFKYSDRLHESYNVQGKLAWKINPNLRLIGEAIYSRSVADRYINNWNIEGYVQKIYRFMALQPSREVQAENARSFGSYLSVYHGPWIERELPRRETYPGTIEARRQCIYPIVVFSKVRDPNDPSKPAQIIRYDNFYARIVHNTRGDEVEVIWDEAIINQSGERERFESRLLFEGFQNPESEFSHFRDDSSYVYFNSAEQTATRTSKNLHLNFALNHNISDDLLYTINLSRVRFNRLLAVNGKEPHEYLTAGMPVIMPSGSFEFNGASDAQWYTDPDYPYFVTCYDYPRYRHTVSTAYVLKADLTSDKWENHRFKTGVQLIYNDLNEELRNYPGLERLIEGGGRVQGLDVNMFHNFNPEGSYYVQDKWQYQGMVVNGGVRVDFFSPGNNTEIEVVSSEIDPHVEKYKFQISPRLGFAFPITDRDKFHFHYGRFTQWPGRDFMFMSQDMIIWGGAIGNPDLDEELTVSYQAGVSHQFSETVAGHFVVFTKDIFGLLSSTRVTDEELGIQGHRFVNRTYASSRGLEVSIQKRLSHFVGGEISYTYSYADGVASDAYFGVTAEGLTHLPTQELPLDWDQRHTLNLTISLQVENKWGATVIYSYGSGLPWTPYDRWTRRQDPLWENSKRLPETHVVNLQGRKKFNVFGQELTLFFEGRNLLDEDILLPDMVAPVAWPQMVDARMDGGSYMTETGEYGGAYMQDIDDDGIDEFVPVNDPTIWNTHRLWRIGFGFEF